MTMKEVKIYYKKQENILKDVDKFVDYALVNLTQASERISSYCYTDTDFKKIIYNAIAYITILSKTIKEEAEHFTILNTFLKEWKKIEKV